MDRNTIAPLGGKTALVSGASRGIGRAVALLLASRGARVIAVARNREGLDNLRSALPGDGHRMVAADLAGAEGEGLLYRDCQLNGFPDIVVANLHNRRPMARMDSVSFEMRPESIFENINYLLKLIPDAVAHQRDNTFGRWIGIGSMISRMGGPGQMHYGAAKNLLGSLIKTIAVENGHKNITANMILPGLIDTDSVRENYSRERFDQLAAMNLFKRPGRPEEVAHAVAFLADPLASYITGIELPVCGGYDLSWALNNLK